MKCNLPYVCECEKKCMHEAALEKEKENGKGR